MRFLTRIILALAILSAFGNKPAIAATTPSFSIGDARASEDDGKLCFPIKKHGTLNALPSTVIFSVLEGTARAGFDFDQPKPVTVSFTAAETLKYGCVVLVNDAVPEQMKTLTGKIAKGTNARLYDGTAIGTITDPDVAAPLPPPDPVEIAVVSEGDSISQFWAGSYPGIFARTHPSLKFCGLAVAGSVLGNPTDGNALVNPTRLEKVYACKPKLVTVLIGANDLVSWNPAFTTETWLARLWGYTATLKAKGYLVAVATVLPQYQPNAGKVASSSGELVAYTGEFNRRRLVVNAAIKAAVGTKIDAVIDFAGDPVMGPDAAAADASLYSDGIHPSDSGQAKLAAIYSPIVERILAGGSVPPPPPPPPANDTWTSSPLEAGGYARARETCSSAWQSTETTRAGVSFAGVTAGVIYRAIAQGWTPYPHDVFTTDFASGQIWTLVNPAGGEAITVVQSCLEGVKKAA